MGIFFLAAVAVSMAFGAWNHTLSAVSTAAVSASFEAVTLSLELLGSLCFWSGMMKVAEDAGVVRLLCKAVKPVLGLLFPKLRCEEKALGLLSMNVGANLLGLGNAATPLGVAAMKELKKLSKSGEAASAEMVTFVVMNTASLQILPTMVATLRASFGAKEPLDILPAVWLVSAGALFVGLLAAKGLFPGKEP